MKTSWYLQELKDYLEHCKKLGVAPRFSYLRFIKSHLVKEEKEFEKTLERIYGKRYKEII